MVGNFGTWKCWGILYHFQTPIAMKNIEDLVIMIIVIYSNNNYNSSDQILVLYPFFTYANLGQLISIVSFKWQILRTQRCITCAERPSGHVPRVQGERHRSAVFVIFDLPVLALPHQWTITRSWRERAARNEARVKSQWLHLITLWWT